MASAKQLAALAKGRATVAAKRAAGTLRMGQLGMHGGGYSPEQVAAAHGSAYDAGWADSGHPGFMGPRLPGHKGAGLAEGSISVPSGFRMTPRGLVRVSKKAGRRKKASRKKAGHKGKTQKQLLREHNRLLKSLAENCGPTMSRKKKASKKKRTSKKRASKKKRAKKVYKGAGDMPAQTIALKALKGSKLPAGMRKSLKARIMGIIKKQRAAC